jgi:phosphatidylglycerophosphate synthase
MPAMKFTYRSGQRPLAGFTIKRGVGQGGFGEVYFAVTDGGKEVALKLLHRHSDAELRGVAHCLNLKHPNLVHLYDLLSDDRGDKWVLMEYVFGESLAQWINRYPTGLPADLAKEWFGAMARAVGYLHDHGVVHRDMKPANIFIEHGHLKVGDYGLSRRISASQGGEMTRKVGTPYYMAPEIKNGNYSTSIDVYACGVILYEMLTGRPPFEGETTEEVLIKHLTETPDFKRVPAAFIPVLKTALEKDPFKRFPNIREFAKAVEAIPTPAQPRPATTGANDPPPLPPIGVNAAAVPVNEPTPRPVADARGRPRLLASGPLPRGFRETLTELTGSVALVPVVAALCVAPWALVPVAGRWTLLGRMFLISVALSWAVLLVGRTARGVPISPWGRRVTFLLAGAAVGVLAFWLDGRALASVDSAKESSNDVVLRPLGRITSDLAPVLVGLTLYYGLTAAAYPWWKLTNRDRKERFRFSMVLLAGFWAAVLTFAWPWDHVPFALALAPPIIASVAVQVASPWVAPPPLPRATRVAQRERDRRRPVRV